MLEPGAMLASVALSTFMTRTAAPTPTKPTAIEPAMPLTVRLSFARTWTPPPATTLPWIEAEVPAGTTDASASLATLPVGAALVIVDFGARERVGDAGVRLRVGVRCSAASRRGRGRGRRAATAPCWWPGRQQAPCSDDRPAARSPGRRS